MRGYKDPEVAVQMAGEKLPEKGLLNETDALEIVRKYYSRGMLPDSKSVEQLIGYLIKIDIAGLVIYVWNRCKNDMEAENNVDIDIR